MVEGAGFEVVIRSGGAEHLLDLGGLFDGCIVYRPEYDDTGRLVELRCIYIDPDGLLFLPAEEQIDRGLIEVFPWVTDDGSFERHRRVLETGEPARFPLRTHVDGRFVALDIATTRVGDLLLVTYTDATEREIARAEAEEVMGEYRSLVDTLPDIVVRLDREMCIRYVNPAGQGLTAVMQRPDPIGRNLLTALRELLGPGAASESLGDRLRATLETGRGDHFEFPMLGRTLDVSLAAEKGSRDEVRSLLLIARDVTSERQVAEERAAVAAKIEQADRLDSLGVLAGGIAHDFNNLLVGMLGNAELALLALAPDDAARPLLDGIVAAAQRASDLTQQLLAYAGRRHGNIEALDLCAIVDDTVALLRSTLAPAQIDTISDRALPSVEGERSQLVQVVMNLVINAVDALDGGRGPVVVTTSLVDLDAGEGYRWSPTSPLPAGHYLSLSVSDPGHGMDPSTVGRIFEPFFSTRSHGRGLGLAVVHGIVRAHGGAIRVDSRPDEGTAMTVLLPAAAGEASASVAVQRTPPAAGEAGRLVLVVDNDDAVRQVVCLSLEHRGLRTEGVATGQAAVDAVASSPGRYAAMLLDLTMPGMSGDEVVPLVRALDPSLPIVIISGYSSDDVAVRLAHLGVDRFVQKPFSPGGLGEAVGAVLRTGVVEP